MSLCYKTIISSCCSCVYVEILSTWEVWRALKRLELHLAAPRATLTPLSCSPNFPRAQYLNICTLTHELIVNLHERYQYVSSGCEESSKRLITHAVPQGSILGPTLFNIHVNDICKVCRNTEVFLYADDTELHAIVVLRILTKLNAW